MNEQPRPHAWPLVLLLATGAWVVLDDLFDAQVLKAGATALMAALVVLPWLALGQRDAVGAWFGGWGARLLVLAAAVATPAALAVLDQASVSDRLLACGLAQVAAVAGLACAERAPRWLVGAVVAVALPGAVVCWAQALGWETTLTSGPTEVVGLSGNSTRAGAALALACAALGATLIGAGSDGGRRGTRLALLVLLAGALVLTRGRGARLALGAAGAAALALAWLRHERLPAPRLALAVLGLPALVTRWARDVSEPGARLAQLVAVLSLALLAAVAVGGEDTLTARKLDDQAAILSGDDPTTGVRLSLLGTAAAMAAEHPLNGVGLGRFVQYAPRYRDPQEAARPGLAGAATVANHPHNEFALAWAEGGWPALLLLSLAMLLTLRRAWLAALTSPELAPRVVLAVLVCGLMLALGQDPWMDPTTALPFWAAVGFAWAPRPDETRAWTQVGKPVAALVLLMGAGLGLLGWPRLDVQMSLRSFLQQSDARGTITTNAWGALLHAGAVGAGDPVPQALLLEYAGFYLGQVRDPKDKADVVLQIERARARLAALDVPQD